MLCFTERWRSLIVWILTRRLATRNKSRVSIHVTKILASVRGVVDPVKIFLTSSLITVQNLVAVSHAVCMHVRGSKLSGTQVPRTLGGVVAADPKKHAPPHLCYLTEFSGSRSNAYGRKVEGPQKIGTLGPTPLGVVNP